MKKLTIILGILFWLMMPRAVWAQERTCTAVYGGGVVCGAATPTEITHQPVGTAIGDANPAIVGLILLAISGLFFYFSKRLNLRYSTLKEA
jgi:hypothetical protein